MKRFASVLFVLFLLINRTMSAYSESLKTESISFYESVLKWVEKIDPQRFDYAFTYKDSTTSFDGIYRRSPELTEINLGNQGRLVLSNEEIGIEYKDVPIIVDLSSMTELFGENKLNSKEISEDLKWLFTRASELVSEAFRPYWDLSVGKNGLSFHLNIYEKTALLKYADALDSLMSEEETERIINRYSGCLKLLFPEVPSSYTELLKLWTEKRESLIDNSGFGSLKADLDLSINDGIVSALSCFGNCTLSYRESYDFDFRYKNTSDGWKADGQIKNIAYGTTPFRLDLEKRGEEFIGSSSVGTSEFDISGASRDSEGMTLHLDSNIDFSADLEIDRQKWIAIIYNCGDTVTATASTDKDLFQATIKTSSTNYSTSLYDYDFRMNKLANGNWQIRLNGIEQDGWGLLFARHYLNAEVGKNKISVMYSDNPVMSNGYELEAEKYDNGYLFRIHAPGNEWWHRAPGYNLEIQKEGMIVKTEFSYPYELWDISGNASLMIDKNNKIKSFTGAAITSYKSNPEMKETRHLIYSPGDLIFVDDLGIYRFKKSEEDEKNIRYTLTHNSQLETEIEAQITESENGDGLSLKLVDKENKYIDLSVTPLPKTEILPVKRQDAITMDIDMFLSLLFNSGL